MFRLRVEWHQCCPNCGTQLVVDFLNDPFEPCPCPWCGLSKGIGPCEIDEDLRQYITRAVKDIESTANSRISVAS